MASALSGFYAGLAGRKADRPTSLAIISPGYDTLFFFASFVVPFLFIAAQRLELAPTLVLFGIWSVTLDVPHLFQTHTRTLLDDDGRKRFGAHTLGAFAVLMGGALLLVATGNAFALWLMFLFYGPYHIIMQHYGIAAYYRRRAGELDPLDGRLDRFLVLATYAFCVSLSIQTTLSYGDVLSPLVRFRELFGPRVEDVRSAAQYASYAFAVGLVVAGALWARRIVALRRLTGAVNRPRVVLLVLAVLNYLIAYVVLRVPDDPLATIFGGIVCITAWHDVQYHGLVWHYNNKKFAKEGAKGSPTLSWLSQDGRLWAYMLALLAVAGVYGLAGLKGGGLTGISAFVFAFTFLHYHMDGVIWRTGKNAEVRGILRFKKQTA